MNVTPKAPADTRDFLEIFEQLRARAGAYVPEAQFSDGSTGAALGNVFARYVQTVLERLNQAPDKNKLAFLDMLALQLTPAREARVPLVFQLNDKAAAGKAPASTVCAAPPPSGSNTQIVFETERELGVTGGKLTEVVSLWPDRDSYIDHSAAFAAGQPFTLFSKPDLVGIPHHLYLAHSKLLALSGSVTLTLEIQLQSPADSSRVGPLNIQWEYWDGVVWRGFLSLDPQCQGTSTNVPDSTQGLIQNGRIELQADGASSQKTAINGITNFWVRGRVTDPLPSASTRILPVIDSIRLSSIVKQPFRASLRLLALQKESGAANALAEFVIQTGRIVLHNAAGVPIKGAKVSVHLNGDPADQFATLQEGTAAGVFSLDFARFSKVDRLSVVFFDVQTDVAVDLDHRAVLAAPALPVNVNLTGLAPDAALADSTKLDTTKPFYPFGQQPQPGSSFYFRSQEAFSKPGANLRIYLPLTSSPLGDIASNDLPNGRTALTRQIEWEYWNGRAWAPLTASSTNQGKLDFGQTEIADFTVPVDMETTTVAGQAGLWVRARLVRGGFGYTQEIKWQAGATPVTNTIAYVVSQPPVLADIRLAYTWQYGPFPLDEVIGYNDFQYKDHTADALWPGTTFAPYERTPDVTPELYLGFDKAPPAAQLGVFFNIQEKAGDVNGPELIWEYWNGFVWGALPSTDGTGRLRLPGIVSLISNDDSAALARFDKPLFWIRGRLKDDNPDPGSPVVNGIFPNAVFASQQSTLTDQAIGLSKAAASQSFQLHQIPILTGERIEVREIFGPRANTEWPLVALDLFGGDETVIRDLEDQLGREGATITDVIRGDLRLRRDRLKNVAEVWVRWKPLLTLAGAGPTDRVYVIDRARGILTFGDGASGRIPPNGASVLGRVLSTGGGASGNVAASTITQLLGVVPGVQAVFNPIAAEGGSDAETLPAFRDRGPQTLRHRGRAISVSDYETLAREASSAVAFSRAIAVHDPGSRTLPGWVTVLIMPNSTDPRPWPSFGLRQEVRTFLEGRAPAELAGAGRIFVTGPSFLPIDVSATIAPLVAAQAGDVDDAAHAAIAAFLHPLFGGPGGNGWDLGRSVYLSDLASALERVEGLDFVQDLELLLDGQLQGSSVAVGPKQIVVAGAIRITLTLKAN